MLEVPNSVYEWQTMTIGSSLLTVVLTVLDALPLLCMLLVLTTSIATLFHVSLPLLVGLKRAVASWGLVIQFLFEIIIFVLSLIGYGRTDIAWGFVMVLIGFIVMLVGIFETPR